jgi:hypothetical protein
MLSVHTHLLAASPRARPSFAFPLPVRPTQPRLIPDIWAVQRETPRQEGVWGSGGDATRILNHGSRTRRITGFTFRPLYSWERDPGTHWVGGWVGPRARSGHSEKEKNPPNLGDRTPVVQHVASHFFYPGAVIIIIIIIIIIQLQKPITESAQEDKINTKNRSKTIHNYVR